MIQELRQSLGIGSLDSSLALHDDRTGQTRELLSVAPDHPPNW
jgi:hypothetical protein